MPIFRMRIPLLACCTLLAGLPHQAAVAQTQSGAAVSAGDSVVRLKPEYRVAGNPDAASRIGVFEFRSLVDSTTALRMDGDFGDFGQRGAQAKRTGTAESEGNAFQAAPMTASRLVKIVAGDSVIYDSNLFRLPSGVDAQAALGASSRSDTINVAYVGLRIDKDYAQQRFQLDLTQTAFRHANFSFLNYQAFEYRGEWNWHVTPRWSGTLSAERRVGTASFADTQIPQRTQRNLRTGDNLRLSLDGSLFGGWHVLLGVFQYQTKYDQGFLPQNSSRTRGAEGGIKYESASGSALSLLHRSIQGDYLNRVPDAVSFSDNAFRQNELELKLDRELSGKSRIQGRLTWIDVRHAHFAERDFSGLAGEWAYIWAPSGKLRIETVAKRDLSAWWQTYSSYRVDDSLSITPIWQIGAKTSLRARVERIRSDFRGPLPSNAGPARGDTLHSAQIGVEWLPLRSLTLDASLQRLRRSSNFSGVDFDTSIAGVNARIKF